MTRLSGILLISSGVALSMIGDVLLKQSAVANLVMLTGGIVFYASGAIPVAIAFKTVDFGSVFLVWEAVTVVAALVVARLLFNEPVTIQRLLALAFALTAIWLSSR
jgi:multidrug transporter EmrE-like cation transporter